MTTRSKAFGSKGPRAAHLVKPGGGLKAEVWDFRNDVEESFSSLEGRTVADAYPELDHIDGAGPAAAGADMVLVGRFLVNGQAFASLTIGAGTSELVITAHKPGKDGNDFTVEVTASGGGETAVLTGSALVLDVNDGASTANAIATLINAAVATCDGYLRAVSGGVGTVHPPAAEASLAGGEGEGWECVVGGVECLPANNGTTSSVASVAELTATVTVPALAPIVATDKAKVYCTVDGVRTDLGAVAVE